ncbi:MAG: thiamine phosphate synthase [Nitratireductor sp.]
MPAGTRRVPCWALTPLSACRWWLCSRICRLSAIAHQCRLFRHRPAYTTSTKADAGNAIGEAGIAAMKARTSLPVVAIGGIGCGAMRWSHQAGADGAAVVSSHHGCIRPEIRSPGIHHRNHERENRVTLRNALTIAGSICGGAGIQGLNGPMSANGVFATTVITALTAQNTA